MHLLRKEVLDNVTEVTHSNLENIVRSCKPCQTFASRSRRFKFTLRDDAQFNSSIYVDLFWIDRKSTLHVVDEETSYQAARCVPSVSAEKFWQALRICWINVHIGPPDVIAHIMLVGTSLQNLFKRMQIYFPFGQKLYQSSQQSL